MTDIAIEYDRKQILHPLYTEEGVAAKPLLISITLIYSHKRLPDSSIWHPEDGAVARGRRRREEVGRSLAQSVRAIINGTLCFGDDFGLCITQSSGVCTDSTSTSGTSKYEDCKDAIKSQDIQY